jgi:hypothetical protein
MVAVFTIAIVSYVTNFADDNDAAVDLADDDRIGSSLQSQDVDDTRVQIDASAEAFAESTIESGDETSTTGGVFKAMSGAYNATKNTLTMGKQVIFGDEKGITGPGIALTALGTFITIMLILYTWKTWAGKNPD